MSDYEYSAYDIGGTAVVESELDDVKADVRSLFRRVEHLEARLRDIEEAGNGV
jgi:hypothetical protein